MPTISLNAFLKILSKNSPQKAQEYGRYLSPGGYDFYWRLKEAAHKLTIGGANYEECVSSISKISRQVEREHNLAALLQLNIWLCKSGASDYFDPPSEDVRSPVGHLTVRLEPTFGCRIQDRRFLIHLWATKGVSLTRNVAGCGLYLLEQHLCIEEQQDCMPAILDLRRPAFISADKLPSTIGPMVASEFAWADGFFNAASRAA